MASNTLIYHEESYVMAFVQPDKVSFHDATLENIQVTGNRITFNVVDARTQDNLPCSVEVTLEQVTLIKADGEVAGTFAMEAQDAEILSFDLHGDGITATLEWNDWEPRRQFVRSYEIAAHDVRVVVVD